MQNISIKKLLFAIFLLIASHYQASLAKDIQTLKVQWFYLPKGSSPSDITTGPDGNIWFCLEEKDEIGQIDKNGKLKTFKISTKSKHSGCLYIAAGQDGNVWFGLAYSIELGKITPNGKITIFPLPESSGGPSGMTAGPDGNIYVAEYEIRTIWKVTPTGKISRLPIIAPNINKDFPAHFTDLTTFGEYIWFPDQAGNQIGCINVNGAFNLFKLSNEKSESLTLSPDTDGNIWFTEEFGNRIGQIDQKGQITEFDLPKGLDVQWPLVLRRGPDSNMWFNFAEYSELGQAKALEDQYKSLDKTHFRKIVTTLGRIDAQGSINVYRLAGQDGRIYSLTAGSDGNLWVTQRGKDAIGKVFLPKN